MACPEIFIGWPGTKRGAERLRPIHAQRADRLLLAAEVVVERPGRHVHLGGNVFDEDVLETALDGEAQRSLAECVAGGGASCVRAARRGRPDRASAVSVMLQTLSTEFA